MERGGSNSIFRFYYVFASSQYLDATRLKSCNRLCFLSLEILRMYKLSKLSLIMVGI